MTSITIDLDTLNDIKDLCRYKNITQNSNNSVNIELNDSSAYCVSNIGYLPAYRLFKTKKYNGENSVECCICLQSIKKGNIIVSMPICGHLYHKACLFNWVDLSKNTFCPYCKQDDF